MREGRIVAEFDRAEATQERIAAAMMSTAADPVEEKMPL
jgi:ABC-type sugar transport system ATPase subunit